MTAPYSATQVQDFYWARATVGSLPSANGLVLYRHTAGGARYVLRVQSVAMADRTDPNVYDLKTGQVRRDPAPLVTLTGFPGIARIACREARVPNQFGWSAPPAGAVLGAVGSIYGG